MIPLYQSFVNTQVSIMRSPTVLQRVLDGPAVQKTRWYKEPGRRLFAGAAEPIERLRDELSIAPRGATEIIDVTFAGPVGGDTEAIVNAVLDQYIKYSSEKSDATEDNLYRQLKEQYKTLETEISGREKVLAGLQKGLGTETPAELVSAKRVRLDQAEAHLRELDGQISVRMLERKELEKITQGEGQARRQAEKLQYVKSISALSADARQHLRSQLGEQKALLEVQAAEAKRLRAIVGTKSPAGNPTSQASSLFTVGKPLGALFDTLFRREGPGWLARMMLHKLGLCKMLSNQPPAIPSDTRLPTGPTGQNAGGVGGQAPQIHPYETAKSPSQDAVGQADRDEIGAGIEIIEREIEAIKWRETELSKSLERRDGKEAPPTTRATARPEYHGDQEWRQRDVAVRAARARLAAMKSRLKDSHPAVIDANSELDLSESLLQSREAQLDEQWQKGPTAVGAPGDREGVLRPQTDAGVAAPGINQGRDLTKVVLDLALLQQERRLLEEQVRKDRDDLERAFDSAQTLGKESQAIAYKRLLFNAVRERLDQKEMERNVPGSIELLTRAMVPSQPTKDRRVVFTVMALFGALGLGAGVSFLRSNLAKAVQGVGDLPPAPRVPFLGQVVLMRKGNGPSAEAVEDNALVAESIRMVRTALLSRLDGRCSAILVSSADTGAGKSTVVLMLARSLVKCGKRVLLIDADLRRRALSERLGLGKKPGLTESLTGGASDDGVICETDTPRLSVMPAGIAGDGTEIEATANGAFKGLLDRLRRSYDIVLLDSPPILPVADSRILSRHVDGTILVVRQGWCRRDDILDSLACLASAGGTLLGTVFIGAAEREGHDYGYPRYPAKA
jgi:capsular exopolysaccharide synthesis family protein